ncbi:MAG: inositol 2-dehydrogenase [Chloroflexi bacterium]|nr:inositol 2-dehydrogenase [Chloroflexota bacterium]
MIKFCQFGVGLIGSIHAANIAKNPKASLRYVVDLDAGAARRAAEKYGAQVADSNTALADPEVDAVLIASPTNTHAELLTAAAKAGKAIFCEKPIDLDIQRVDDCLRKIEKASVPVAIGFNRRFDPSHRAVHDALREGRVGTIEMVLLTSRGPEPPPISYVKVSGGQFRDQMIHFFDLARWLLGEEPIEVFAMASCMVDPAIGEAGDVDTSMVLMKTASGALCHINNSRRTTYGYDERIEVFGSLGMVQSTNPRPKSVHYHTAEGSRREGFFDSWLDRFLDSYRVELDHFIDAIGAGTKPMVTEQDGRLALVLANAALRSYETGSPVKI